MPGYKGHLIGGVAAYTILFLLIPERDISMYTATKWLFFSLAGSLFPDIDTKSKGQKLFYWIIFFFFIVAITQQNFVACTVMGIIAIVPLLVKHRGLFHSLWFVVGCPLGVAILIAAYFPGLSELLFLDTTFFIFGALSHLLLDFGIR